MNQQTEEQDRLEGLQAARWLLDLNAAQIKDALAEANHSMDSLTGSITELLEAVRYVDETVQISVAFSGLPDDSPLHRFDGQVLEYVQGVLTALQFYDRLSQRLDHVARALDDLAGLTQQPGQLDRHEAWRQLLDGINRRHSMPEEQDLFLRHLPLAPLIYQASEEANADAGDIEFF
ncbi:MAG: HbrB domain-containing protein [Gammaproteobacteria bacterium SHHR-1]|uniref:hypothetical protein n=1 Tax=Magnetovirga frankeli TaxID=947516 RepID=UPI001293931C|nr:hypothetical protein D5125_06135 [gamma proteobacterium SS-5]